MTRRPIRESADFQTQLQKKKEEMNASHLNADTSHFQAMNGKSE